MQPSAARVPAAQYEAIQHFITDSPWDWRETQGRLLDRMIQELGTPEGLLVLDDVPLVKQGEKSPGVARQYCGVTKGVGNCQALVDLVYVHPREGMNRETVGFCFALDLYLPKSWAEDAERCRKAGIPTPVLFREKWRIGLEQIERARAHKVPHRAILADCGYGDAQDLRAQLRAWKEPYVMEVTASEARVVSASTRVFRPGERLSKEKGRRRIARPHLPEGLSTVSPKAMAEAAEDWAVIRWGEGTKGPLEGRFTRRRVRVGRQEKIPTEEVGWLLLEATSDGVRSWICWGLGKASLAKLATLAHRRWVIERFHEDAKMELGLDHFEGRRWRGRNHHLTLVLIAHTFLVREQARLSVEGVEGRLESEKGEEPLPTLAEMRRRVVLEVAWALVSRAVSSRRRKEREGWGWAIARYWAGAG